METSFSSLKTNRLSLPSQKCFISASLVANFSLDRDEFERALASKITKDIVIEISDSNNVLIKITPLPSADELERIVEWEKINRASVVKTITFKNIPDNAKAVLWNVQDNFLQFSRVLTCVHVRFNPEKYSFKLREKPMSRSPLEIVIELGEGQMVLRSPEELNSIMVEESGNLSVCLDLLKEALSKIKFSKLNFILSDHNVIALWQHVVTLVCIGLSVAGLIFTITTYALFSALRTVAGVYNMLLSMKLLVAQTSLLLSAYINEPGPWCTFLAVCTHFAWLDWFCWSSICCFHMFQVFAANTIRPHRNGSILVCVLKRIVLSPVLSGLTVVSVISTSFVVSSGENIGYGKRSCYVNTPLLVGLATMLPLGIAIVCNTTFFAVVVWGIQAIRKLQSSVDVARMDTKQNLTVYVRLSTLTGACWTLAIIAELVDSDPLRFVYIVVNGLQGAFIFISYMCNPRVLVLYMECLDKLRSKEYIRDVSTPFTVHSNISETSRS